MATPSELSEVGMTTNQEGSGEASDLTASRPEESNSTTTAVAEDASGETGGEESTVPEKTQQEIEKEEEAKLRSKYPGVKGPGSSAFLQKRLSKGTKYFDSGDYNMAKAKTLPPGTAAAVAAAAAATADPAFKQPQPPGASGSVISAGAVPLRSSAQNPTGSAIPTPECVAHRRLSHLQSKLASNTLS